MWLLQLFGLVLVAGLVLGLVWRFVEDKLEKRARAKREALDTELDQYQQSAATVNTVVASTTKNN